MTDEKKGRRMYLVEQLDDNGFVVAESVVEARSQPGAIAIKTLKTFRARPATTYDVARIMAAEYAAKGGGQ